MNAIVVARVLFLFMGAFFFLIAGMLIQKDDNSGAWLPIVIGIACDSVVWFIQ